MHWNLEDIRLKVNFGWQKLGIIFSFFFFLFFSSNFGIIKLSELKKEQTQTLMKEICLSRQRRITNKRAILLVHIEEKSARNWTMSKQNIQRLSSSCISTWNCLECRISEQSSYLCRILFTEISQMLVFFKFFLKFIIENFNWNLQIYELGQN